MRWFKRKNTPDPDASRECIEWAVRETTAKGTKLLRGRYVDYSDALDAANTARQYNADPNTVYSVECTKWGTSQ